MAGRASEDWSGLLAAIILQAIGEAQQPGCRHAAEASAFLSLPLAQGLALECGVDPAGFRQFVAALPEPMQPGLMGWD